MDDEDQRRVSLLTILKKIFGLRPRWDREAEERISRTVLERVNRIMDREVEDRLVQAVLQRSERSYDSTLNLAFLIMKPVQELANELQWQLSAGVDLTGAKIIRYIPVRIYLKRVGDETAGLELEVANDVVESIRQLLEGSFIPVVDMPTERGSAWRRFWAKSKEKLSKHEAEEKVAAALELRSLDKPQAETTKLMAEGIALVLKELSPIDNACVQVANALLVKRTINGKSEVHVRTLSPLQLKRLESDQNILLDPEQAMKLLTSPEQA